jgi:hypothetical protein
MQVSAGVSLPLRRKVAMQSKPTNHFRRSAALLAVCALITKCTLVGQADPSVPIYPGAVKLPIPAGFPVPNTCGSKTLMDMYQSGAPVQTVTHWYAAHTSGFVTVPSEDDETLMLAGDGSMGVKVRASRVDPTSIAVIHYRPALGAKWVSAIRDPKSAASTATLTSMCSHG